MTPIEAEAKQLLENNYRQVVEIQVGDTTITESDVIQGSFALNRTVCSMDSVEIGSAIASELSFDLRNYDKKFNDVSFESEEMSIKIGVKKWDAKQWENAQLYWIPLGKFIVSKSPRKKEVIHVTALDRMIKFDKDVNKDLFQFPITIGGLVEKCCQICGVPLKAIGNRPNKNYSVATFPSVDRMTYRNLIQWSACLMGTCATINADGQLEFRWYEGEPVYSSTQSNRYGSDIYENDISLTGITYTTSDDSGEMVEYIAGSRGNVIDVSECLLIGGDVTSVLTNIWDAIKTTYYRPFSAESKPVPYLWPMDRIMFTDRDGIEHDTIVTSIDYSMNANSNIEAAGITETENSYFRDNSMTTSQIKALDAVRKFSRSKANSVEQATLEMNEVLAGSLGLHKSEMQESDGSTTIYWHDAPTLAQSSIIYTFKSGGFAWTKKWNNGSPIWQYGFTKEGNAILNAIYAHKITGEALEIHSVSEEILDPEILSAYTKIADFDVQPDQIKAEIKKEATTQVKQVIGTRKLYTCLTNTINTPAKNLFTEGSKVPTSTNRYLWGFERIQTDSSSWTDDTIRLICVYGEKGDPGESIKGDPGKDGVSFSGLINQYSISTSNTTAPTSGWSSVMPSYPTTEGAYYLWERQQVTKSNGTSETTTPTLNVFWSQMSSEWATLKVQTSNIALEVGKKVNADAIISAINMSPEEVKIEAAKIVFEGLVTANGGFQILEDGSIKAVDGEFSGSIGATGLDVYNTNRSAVIRFLNGEISGKNFDDSRTLYFTPLILRFGDVSDTSMSRYTEVDVHGIDIRDDNYNFLNVSGKARVQVTPSGIRLNAGSNSLSLDTGALFTEDSLYNMFSASVGGTQYYGVMTTDTLIQKIGFESSLMGTSYFTVTYFGNTYKIATSSSDARLKTNIERSVESALKTIRKIKHYTFTWKDGGYEQDVGYIAQQLESEVREDFVLPPTFKGDRYAVNDPRILPYATKAIQELDQEVELLKAKNVELEERIRKIEKLLERSASDGTTDI